MDIILINFWLVISINLLTLVILSYKNIKLSLIYLLTFTISYFLFYYVALHFFPNTTINLYFYIIYYICLIFIPLFISCTIYRFNRHKIKQIR
ncbi:hypothetical protein AAG94_19690 [Escherichia albertii]|nr:hypothetical protein [Escherichia albertii]EFO4720670.1 hypothetical protein [Escherichia albertii]